MKNVIIYTTGCFVPQNERKPGGYAAILTYKDHQKIISGSRVNTSAQMMELTALIEAVKCLKYPCDLTIVTDSQYIVKGYAGEYRTTSMWAEWRLLNTVISRGQHKIKFVSKDETAHSRECAKLAKKAIDNIKEAVCK